MIQRPSIPPRFVAAYAALALLLVSTPAARAQDDFDPQYRGQEVMPGYVEFGLDPRLIMTTPLGSVASVRDAEPCSEDLGGAARFGPGLGAFATYVFSGPAEPMGFVLRGIRLAVGFDDLSSRFTAPFSATAFDTDIGAYVPIEHQFIAEFDLRYLRSAVEADMALSSAIHVRAGASVGIPLSGSSIEQEQIVSPSNETFLDGSQERTISGSDGDLADLGLRIGVAATAAYRLPLGARTFAEANLGVDLGLTHVQPDWSPLVLQAGIAIGYGLVPTKAPPPPPPVVEAPPPPPPPFTADIDVTVQADQLPIEMRRQIVARYIPIIPVVFFEQNQSQMPDRYELLDSPSAADAFSTASLPAEADQMHHHVLDVIGLRLREHPKARVTLTGTTSEDESDRAALARQRAERVASYLHDIWGIESKRVNVQSRVSPAVASNSQYAEGRAENQRVELEFSDEDVYSPVQLRSVEPVEKPEAIGFGVSVTASRTVSSWAMRIRTPDATIKEFTGTGTPPQHLQWDLTQNDREIALSRGEVDYSMDLTDDLGRSVSSTPRPIPLRLDTTVSVRTSASLKANTAEFLLVTFDYNRAVLTSRGRRELRTILERIGDSSSVEITGYTDELGDAQRNRELAEQRARLVATMLPKNVEVTARGADPAEAPYSGKLPEGRFLSRTVRVVINNPK